VTIDGVPEAWVTQIKQAWMLSPFLKQLCITGENEQPFRSMANGNFGRSRTPISDEVDCPGGRR
jgi:hypothetical protein